MVLFCSIETSSLGLRSCIVFEASSRMNSEVPSFDADGGHSGTPGLARRKKVAHGSSRCLKRVVSGGREISRNLHKLCHPYKSQQGALRLFFGLSSVLPFSPTLSLFY